MAWGTRSTRTDNPTTSQSACRSPRPISRSAAAAGGRDESVHSGAGSRRWRTDGDFGRPAERNWISRTGAERRGDAPHAAPSGRGVCARPPARGLRDARCALRTRRSTSRRDEVANAGPCDRFAAICADQVQRAGSARTWPDTGWWPSTRLGSRRRPHGGLRGRVRRPAGEGPAPARALSRPARAPASTRGSSLPTHEFPAGDGAPRGCAAGAPLVQAGVVEDRRVAELAELGRRRGRRAGRRSSPRAGGRLRLTPGISAQVVGARQEPRGEAAPAEARASRATALWRPMSTNTPSVL